MSLNYDLKEVPDYKTKCYFTHRDELHLDSRTQSLIFATMLIGMNQITDKNWQDFYARLRAYSLVSGHANWQRLNAADVKEHIGLRTNANIVTDRNWWQNLKHVNMLEVNNEISARKLEV